MKRIFLLAAVVFIAQTTLALSKGQLLKKIEEAFYKEDFSEVLDLSVNLEKEHANATEHLYYKNIAAHLTTNRGGDLDDVLKFESTFGKTDIFYNYWVGRIHLYRYEFDEAEKRLRAFLKIDNYTNPVIEEEARMMIEMIKKARPYYENPDDYEIEMLPAGVNSDYSEISPAFFNGHNELIFASDRNPKDSHHPADKYSIYHSFKNGDKWSEPTVIENLGEFEYENAKVEIIDNSQRLYTFSASNGSLLYSEYKNDSWTAPVEFDTKIRSKHIESHFFINDSEDKIFFVSGNRRDKEIWFTELKDGNWTEPGPVPGAVNSAFDEESPFLSHKGDVLYFSSNRPESMGGYDVFMSKYDEKLGVWGPAENMGFPINTIDNDINFEVTPSDQSGYMSSDRLHGVGEYDIYYFHKITKIPLRGRIVSADGQPVNGAVVKFHPVSYQDEAFMGETDADGNFEVMIPNKDDFRAEVLLGSDQLHEENYTSYVPNDGLYLSKDFTVTLPTTPTEEKDYTEIYEGEPSEKGEAKPALTGVISKVYFAFNSYELSAAAKSELKAIAKTLSTDSNIEVVLEGHSDNIGPEAINLTLSEQRARAAKKFLITQGIAADRISIKGFGESKPAAPNDTEEEGRALNRRAEIRVAD
ncbi:OmpA family protein [Marinoscillum furvescens]|uniref:Outer membrane protein OmpA-like peptidoglycan-associated protein n=1 Tax=Marinoscillum furvescens DSM 4134 TaxID=1122208 RepID=A0A3D9LFW9_MARFU|nr:OmpA family protein [Marinoscillum furvescens]REE05560.1 outer membrane protein OmpA-like peptidoglycan-associated protein [Marinoscillum furvescens DSM 4134]